MTSRRRFEEDKDFDGTPQWMTLFISLMLVLLTLFIFLTTFAQGDRRKIQEFKQEFRKSLMLAGDGDPGAFSITESGTSDDPIQQLITRMKSKGINKKLMDDFLTLQQIKDFEVMDGSNGVSLILPEVLTFEKEGDGLLMTPKAQQYLTSIAPLVMQLPYLVVIKGYADKNIPGGYADALEFSTRRAMKVYDYFIGLEVSPVKIKVAGCGDAFQGSSVPQDKVEIIFKTTEL